MPSLSDILSNLIPDDAGYAASIAEDWMQGRTSYGGLTSALMLAAAHRAHRDLPPLRSALVNFTGPVGAAPRLSTRLLRQGRNVTTVHAEATSDGQVAAMAQFSFGQPRDSHVAFRPAGPDAPPPETLEPLIPEFAAAMAPKFQKNFDLRLIDGARPFMGSDRGYLRCWARHRAAPDHSGTVPLLCLADILPPAIYPMLRKPGRTAR